MADREKVISEFKDFVKSFSKRDDTYYKGLFVSVLALLKEQEAMNVDAFMQWCIDSHIMGDATVRGIKYWVGKYKETNESR